jgi:Protein of unknown function (DUF3892)
MADRQVTRTRKDPEGNILALCLDSAAWSPRQAADVINDIDNHVHTYFVLWPGGLRTEVRVIDAVAGKYVRTDRDNTTLNNLDDLPDC